jgi:DNA primase
VERQGAEALTELVGKSVPFVVFHVERILEKADLRSAEGRDRALEELRPVLAELPVSALRDELVRRVAGRLELSEARLGTLLDGALRPSANGRGRAAPGVRGIDQGLRSERTFLVLCVALPEEGQRALSAIDPDELLTSEIFRRAARHLVGRTASPLSDLPADDEPLARLMADLVARAGRVGSLSAQELEHARLVLELARVDRAIARARAQSAGGISTLAREREAVLAAIRTVVARMEKAV